MPCKLTNNCDKFPDLDCYDTEKECQCNCEGGTLDPDSDECKCIAQERECVGGRVRPEDCACFCGPEKYLDQGVCYKYQYSCDGQNCFEVRGQGQYTNWADCNLNCGGGPPPCFPVPTPPVGRPLLCPNGAQYGIIMHIYNPAQCRYIPFEIVWGNCDTLPPPPEPPGGGSSGTSGESSSSGGCPNCEADHDSIPLTGEEICGQTVPTIAVTKICNSPFLSGGFRVFEWCQDCGCDGKPTLQRQALYRYVRRDPLTNEFLCAFQFVPLSPNLAGPFPCPAPCESSSSSSSSSTSAESGESSSSATCGVDGPTAINFTGSTQTGAPLNNFGPDDYVEVVVYSPTGLQQARDAETKWTFYVVYPDPTTNPAETPTRYNITSGDFSEDDWPSFILTSERLLETLDLNFATAPNGNYPFQLCAEAVNCAGIYDTKCSPVGIVVRVTDGTDPVSSSSTSAVSSSSSSSSVEPINCNPGGPFSSRILYFLGSGCPGGTSEWARLSNWRELPAGTTGPVIGNLCNECVPTSLPDETDTVILRRSVTRYSNAEPIPSTPPTVRQLIGLSTGDLHGLFIHVRANISADIGGLFYLGRDETVTPPRVGEIEAPNSVVNFKGSAVNYGRVKGTAVFFDNTVNESVGEITCGATFNDTSRRLYSEVYADRVRGTVVCNTTAVPCNTSTSSTPPDYCPTISAPLSAALVAGSGGGASAMYAAVVYTNELPSTFVTPPPGWQKQGSRMVKITDEDADILTAQNKLWDLKNEIGLFYDNSYRVSMLGANDSWYAVSVHFGYAVTGYTEVNGKLEKTFTHILDEQTFDQD